MKFNYRKQQHSQQQKQQQQQQVPLAVNRMPLLLLLLLLIVNSGSAYGYEQRMPNWGDPQKKTAPNFVLDEQTADFYRERFNEFVQRRQQSLAQHNNQQRAAKSTDSRPAIRSSYDIEMPDFPYSLTTESWFKAKVQTDQKLLSGKLKSVAEDALQSEMFVEPRKAADNNQHADYVANSKYGRSNKYEQLDFRRAPIRADIKRRRKWYMSGGSNTGAASDSAASKVASSDAYDNSRNFGSLADNLNYTRFMNNGKYGGGSSTSLGNDYTNDLIAAGGSYAENLNSVKTAADTVDYNYGNSMNYGGSIDNIEHKTLRGSLLDSKKFQPSEWEKKNGLSPQQNEDNYLPFYTLNSVTERPRVFKYGYGTNGHDGTFGVAFSQQQRQNSLDLAFRKAEQALGFAPKPTKKPFPFVEELVDKLSTYHGDKSSDSGVHALQSEANYVDRNQIDMETYRHGGANGLRGVSGGVGAYSVPRLRESLGSRAKFEQEDTSPFGMHNYAASPAIVRDNSFLDSHIQANANSAASMNGLRSYAMTPNGGANNAADFSYAASIGNYLGPPLNDNYNSEYKRNEMLPMLQRNSDNNYFMPQQYLQQYYTYQKQPLQASNLYDSSGPSVAHAYQSQYSQDAIPNASNPDDNDDYYDVAEDIKELKRLATIDLNKPATLLHTDYNPQMRFNPKRADGNQKIFLQDDRIDDEQNTQNARMEFNQLHGVEANAGSTSGADNLVMDVASFAAKKRYVPHAISNPDDTIRNDNVEQFHEYEFVDEMEAKEDYYDASSS